MKKVLLSLSGIFAIVMAFGQGSGNGPVNSFTGFEYEFDYDNGANFCSDHWDSFDNANIDVTGAGSSDSYVNVNFNGSQTAYETMGNRFHQNCGVAELELDFSASGDNVIKARIAVNQDVQVILIAAVDYNENYTYADGTGADPVQVQTGGYVEVEFTIPSTTWDNKNLDLSKVVGWGIGIRDYNDKDAAPSGLSTVSIDWIQFGSAASGNSSGDSENFRTPSGNGYEFNFSSSAAANCVNSMNPTIYFGNARDGYTQSSTFDGSMTLTTDGTQLGGGSWQLAMHDRNSCTEQAVDMSSTAHRFIEVRIKSSVDVPEFVCLPFDQNFLLGDKNADIKSLTANQWTIVTIDVSPMQNSGGDFLNSSNLHWLMLAFRNAYNDNQEGGSTGSVIGTFEIDYIKMGDAVSVTCTSAPSISTQPEDESSCAGENIAFNVSASGATEYAWKKVGSSSLLGNSSSLTIFDVEESDEGTYYCEVTNDCGTTTSNTALLNVDDASVISASVSSDVACEGETINFEFVLSDGGASYQWYGPAGLIPGATQSTYSFVVDNSTDGNYYCIGSVGNCQAQSNTALVSVTGSPNKPNISQSMGALNATGSNGVYYVWMHDCGLVSNTSATLGINQNGSYQVIAIGANGCASEPSDIFAVVGTIALKEERPALFEVYPNPNDGQFELTFNFVPEKVQIINVHGETIYEAVPSQMNHAVDLGILDAGIYFVTSDFGNRVETQKIVIN